MKGDARSLDYSSYGDYTGFRDTTPKMDNQMGKHMDIGDSHPDVYVGFRLYLLVVSREGRNRQDMEAEP